ncbi:5-(carboxyamino)imidazole ribonucleotide synthase [Micrococcales bacterium KH10]|nr:5-(carboxyamino)imidazole ribonucleotide synthase [Micrococcales bacterium KH10]
MTAPILAVIGGGQLARMMAPAAARLGIQLRVLVEAADGSAAQVLQDAPVGAAKDETAVTALVRDAAALTFEHEHVDDEMLVALRTRGLSVQPSPEALIHAQDKIVMRRRLTELGVPCPRWLALAASPAAARAELDQFIAESEQNEAVVKTSRGGYDGKGVRVVASASDVADWIDAAAVGGPPLLVEEKVPFSRELAVLVVRNPSGESVTYDVVESIQRDGVCSEVIAPAPNLAPEIREQAGQIATTIADGLHVTGVLAVEMFEAPAHGGDTRLLVNELAMRPHNSGHWTIDGAATSQFEQHVRAVLDLPLGPTRPRTPWTVMVNVLGSQLDELTDVLPRVLRECPDARVELYGKQIRPGRKLGHVNVTGVDLVRVREQANRAAAILRGEE